MCNIFHEPNSLVWVVGGGRDELLEFSEECNGLNGHPIEFATVESEGYQTPQKMENGWNMSIFHEIGDLSNTPKCFSTLLPNDYYYYFI